jgi:hypothetical protein
MTGRAFSCAGRGRRPERRVARSHGAEPRVRFGSDDDRTAVSAIRASLPIRADRRIPRVRAGRRAPTRISRTMTFGQVRIGESSRGDSPLRGSWPEHAEAHDAGPPEWWTLKSSYTTSRLDNDVAADLEGAVRVRRIESEHSRSPSSVLGHGRRSPRGPGGSRRVRAGRVEPCGRQMGPCLRR